MTVRVGVLGAGFMGSTHARAYHAMPGVEVAQIYAHSGNRASTLAEELATTWTDDLAAVLADPVVDAVDICLPSPQHRPAAEAAVAAGKHVLLEKPLVLDAAQADGLLAAPRETGRILMIAHVLRFWGEYVSLVELVHSGKLGKPVSATAARLSQPPAWSDWPLDPAMSGGAVLDLCVHDFDMLNWLLGAPRTVYARGRERLPGLWNDVHAIVDYGAANGMVDGCLVMPRDWPFTSALKVLCEGGAVELLFRAGGVSVEMGGGTSLLVHEPGKAWKLPPKPGNAYDNQAEYFVDCIRRGVQPVLGTPEQARLAVAVANAARRSLESGEVARL